MLGRAQSETPDVYTSDLTDSVILIAHGSECSRMFHSGDYAKRQFYNCFNWHENCDFNGSDAALLIRNWLSILGQWLLIKLQTCCR
ncbi:MAG: hypothetical protein SGI77_25920 [Pirellulaceae bacterium]|nr:hypothetical protein [Pirellulaceae bacterium]